MVSPVTIPNCFAILLFAKTIPALLFSSPPMIAGIVRISTVSPLLNKSKADQDKMHYLRLYA